MAGTAGLALGVGGEAGVGEAGAAPTLLLRRQSCAPRAERGGVEQAVPSPAVRSARSLQAASGAAPGACHAKVEMPLASSRNAGAPSTSAAIGSFACPAELAGSKKVDHETGRPAASAFHLLISERTFCAISGVIDDIERETPTNGSSVSAPSDAASARASASSSS